MLASVTVALIVIVVVEVWKEELIQSQRHRWCCQSDEYWKMTHHYWFDCCWHDHCWLCH